MPARTDGHRSKPYGRARGTTGRTAKPGNVPRAAGKKAKAAASTRPPDKGEAHPGETPLRIPFGNKEAAQRFGARYRAGGWYAPPGADLDPFRVRGWL